MLRDRIIIAPSHPTTLSCPAVPFFIQHIDHICHDAPCNERQKNLHSNYFINLYRKT